MIPEWVPIGDQLDRPEGAPPDGQAAERSEIALKLK